MPVTNLKTALFGKAKTGMTGQVGYTLYASDGTISQVRTTTGVFELIAGQGTYASEITFADDFNGVVVWDVTMPESGIQVFASEEYNSETSATVALEAVAEDIAFIKDIEGGMWQIDRDTKQMIFYKSDNITEIARFDLFDMNGTPSVDLIYKRERV
jgi:hypothetical protein